MKPSTLTEAEAAKDYEGRAKLLEEGHEGPCSDQGVFEAYNTK